VKRLLANASILLSTLMVLSVLLLREEPAIQLARVRKLSATELSAARARALSGDADAQLTLGLAYDGGKQTFKPDSAEARRWYEMSAKQGNLDARFWLVGLDYPQGQEPSVVRSRYLDLAKSGQVGGMNVYAGLCAEGTEGQKTSRPQ
jgi:TPR repeat protein